MFTMATRRSFRLQSEVSHISTTAGVEGRLNVTRFTLQDGKFFCATNQPKQTDFRTDRRTACFLRSLNELYSFGRDACCHF
jgi:hypothetical protein